MHRFSFTIILTFLVLLSFVQYYSSVGFNPNGGFHTFSLSREGVPDSRFSLSSTQSAVANDLIRIFNVGNLSILSVSQWEYPIH